MYRKNLENEHDITPKNMICIEIIRKLLQQRLDNCLVILDR